MDDADSFNPVGPAASAEDIWRYDLAGSPSRIIPVARSIGPADLLVTRMKGVPGDAERLARMFGDNLRYCHERKKWLVWFDRAPCWHWDDSGGIALAMVAEVIHETYRQARALGQVGMEKAALKTLYVRQLREILTAAEQSLRVPLDALDAKPDLLACANGTIDLPTGALSASQREHFITRSVSSNYDPGADAPVFDSFLRRALGGDYQASSAMQMYLGYSLTGRTSSKVLFLAVGPGDSGKSTLLRCFYSLLGELAGQISVETLMKGAEHSNNAAADLAVLRGARFAMTSEVDAGHRLNVSRLKAITQGTGGRIRAALKYENPMEFPETHKIWIDANFRPIVPPDDQALFNRIICIPFDVVVPVEQQDRKLSEKLAAEAEGVLSWAVKGAFRWYRAGGVLPRPGAIAAASNAYRSAMDSVIRFVEDACERDPLASVSSTGLYHSFEHWARQQRTLPVSQKRFSQELIRQGFFITKRESGNLVEGLRLL